MSESQTNPNSLANLREPFGVGNGVAEKHGAQVSGWKLEPRVLQLADELRPQIAGYQPGDEIVLRTLCLVLARLERASAWVEENGIFGTKRGEVLGIVRFMSSWESSAHKLASSLGLTPASRARIGSDAAQTRVSAALEQHLSDAYGGEE